MKKIYCPVNGWDCCDDYALFDEMFDGLDDEEY